MQAPMSLASQRPSPLPSHPKSNIIKGNVGSVFSDATNIRKALAVKAQLMLSRYPPGTDPATFKPLMGEVLLSAVNRFQHLFDAAHGSHSVGAKILQCLHAPADDLFALHAGLRSGLDIMPNAFKNDLTVRVQEQGREHSVSETLSEFQKRMQAARGVKRAADESSAPARKKQRRHIGQRQPGAEIQGVVMDEAVLIRVPDEPAPVPSAPEPTSKWTMLYETDIMDKITVTNIIVPCSRGDGVVGGFLGEQSTCIVFRMGIIDQSILTRLFAGIDDHRLERARFFLNQHMNRMQLYSQREYLDQNDDVQTATAK